MKNPHNQTQPDPDNINVSEVEILRTTALMASMYDMCLPKSDAARLAVLTKKLALLESDKPSTAIDDTAQDLKEILAQNRTEDISETQALSEAKTLLALAILQEKHGIAAEIWEIIITHRPIPNDPNVTRKTTELLELQYGVSLPEPQLEQVIQYLWRVLWRDEGLKSSLEACLDDLLRSFEKQRRQAQSAHHGVQKALDWTVKKLTGIDSNLL